MGLASCSSVGSLVLNSLWLIEADPHRCGSISGFDHGVGHSLLLLYDAKAPLGKNSNYFNGLGHDLSNPSIGLLYIIIKYLVFITI